MSFHCQRDVLFSATTLHMPPPSQEDVLESRWAVSFFKGCVRILFISEDQLQKVKTSKISRMD